MQKINVTAFSLSCCLVWGIGLLLATWWIMLFEGNTGEVPFLGKFYRGYSISPLGSLIGCAWALSDGLRAGAIIAWLYNIFNRA